jgi:hypothetical protein
MATKDPPEIPVYLNGTEVGTADIPTGLAQVPLEVWYGIGGAILISLLVGFIALTRRR